MRVAAYTLMSNHFHLVAIGDQTDAISLFMMELSGLYATYLSTATLATSGRAASTPPCSIPPLGPPLSVTWRAGRIVLTPSWSGTGSTATGPRHRPAICLLVHNRYIISGYGWPKLRRGVDV